MSLVKNSRNRVWRVWWGDYKVGGKGKKKKVGVSVALTIRSDRGAEISEQKLIGEVSNLLRKYASQHDPE